MTGARAGEAGPEAGGGPVGAMVKAWHAAVMPDLAPRFRQWDVFKASPQYGTAYLLMEMLLDAAMTAGVGV